MPAPGTTVTCTSTPQANNQNGSNGYGTGSQDGLTINVQSGATVTGTFNGIAVNNNNTINNAGTITGLNNNFPDGNGIAAGFPAQVFFGIPGAPGPINLTVNNASTGIIQGDLNGIFAGNDAGTSTVNVNNSGRILGTNAGGSAAIAADNVNVTNNVGGTIDGTAVGVTANNVANVVNYGTISASNGGSAIAAFISNISNYGTLSTTGGSSTAIDTNTGTIVNNGTVTAAGSGFFGSPVAVHVNDDATITNNSTGTITATTSNGFGIRSENNVTVNNAGTIAANASGGTGIGVTNVGNVTNSGMISANGNGGIGVGSNGGTLTVTNSGTITANGTNGTAIYSTGVSLLSVANSGTILATGTGGAGIFSFGTVNATNNGTILVGKNGTGIAADSNSIIFNSGTITANSTGAFGVEFTGDGSTFNNSGTVRTFGNNGATIDMCLCSATNSTANNLAGGVLDGKLSIRGGGNTLNNAGLVTITDTGTTIGPGAFIVQQTLGAANTYAQTSTGTLALRMNNAGAVDRLIADALNLTGTLRIVIQPQLYPNVLTSANAAVQITPGQPASTTTFSNFVASSPFFTVTPIYTGTPSSFTAINIQLGRIPFGSVPGSTLNQKAVGNALEPGYSPGLNPASVAGQFYVNLLAATSVGVLDNLSGEGTAALQNASIGAGSQFNNATLGQFVFGDTSGTTSIIIPPAQYAATPKPRGADAFASVLKAPPAPATQTGRWRLWTAGFGGYRTIDGNAFPIGSANQTIRNYGGAFGFDYQAAPDLLLGFAAGGSEANVSVPDRSTKGNLTGGHLGVYGLKTWGAAYFAASANYARFDNSTTRTIAGVGPTENAAGQFASDQLSARLELGWKRAFANTNLTPFVAIEPAALWARGYTETSTTLGGTPGVLGLAFAPRTTTSLPTFVGVQADTRIAFANGAVVSPYARASWVHEFEPSRQITATFVSLPAGAFTVDGARPARDSGRLDAGSKIQLDTTRSLFANVSGEWSGISQSYSATAGLKVALQ